MYSHSYIVNRYRDRLSEVRCTAPGVVRLASCAAPLTVKGHIARLSEIRREGAVLRKQNVHRRTLPAGSSSSSSSVKHSRKVGGRRGVAAGPRVWLSFSFPDSSWRVQEFPCMKRHRRCLPGDTMSSLLLQWSDIPSVASQLSIPRLPPNSARLPFRLLCRRWGCDVAFTPMMIASDFVRAPSARCAS